MRENTQKINTVIVHRIAPAKRRPSYAWPWKNPRHLIKWTDISPLSPDQTERGKAGIQRGCKNPFCTVQEKGKGKIAPPSPFEARRALYRVREMHTPAQRAATVRDPVTSRECANTHTPVAHTHTHGERENTNLIQDEGERERRHLGPPAPHAAPRQPQP